MTVARETDYARRRRIAKARVEAANRHCEMLRETLKMVMDATPHLPPALEHHALQVLAATTRRERDLIGTPRPCMPIPEELTR